jgi:enediyne biosynthesis protein E4
LHFGLGRAGKVDTVEIAWPSGLKDTFKNLTSNRCYIAREGKGITESEKSEQRGS